MTDWMMGLIFFLAPNLLLLLFLFIRWQEKSGERLLNKFDREQWEERQKAIKKLMYGVTHGVYNPENASYHLIIQAFLRALKDRNWHVRKEAVRALRNKSIRKSIQQLFLPSVVEPVRLLMNALSDTSEHVRREAAMVLGNLHDTQSVEPLLNALRDESGFVRREAAIVLGNIRDIRVFNPLLGALGKDYEYMVRKEVLTALKKACSLVHVIVFGNCLESKVGRRHTICNPDISQLTVPMSRLKCIIIDTETYDFYQVERFVTYAINYIGQKYLKKKVEVHIYGNSQSLQLNLWNTLTNLCKCVYVHEEDDIPILMN